MAKLESNYNFTPLISCGGGGWSVQLTGTRAPTPPCHKPRHFIATSGIPDLVSAASRHRRTEHDLTFLLTGHGHHDATNVTP